jgi:alpha-D-ribose 1-methylphosphonate 5-phosphate C-P lyase
MNKQDRNKEEAEIKRNSARIETFVHKFSKAIIDLKETEQEHSATLVDTRYEAIYKHHLAQYIILIKLMEEEGKYKYTSPNKMYFKEMYNPIDGKMVTNN